MRVRRSQQHLLAGKHVRAPKATFICMCSNHRCLEKKKKGLAVQNSGLLVETWSQMGDSGCEVVKRQNRFRRNCLFPERLPASRPSFTDAASVCEETQMIKAKTLPPTAPRQPSPSILHFLPLPVLLNRRRTLRRKNCVSFIFGIGFGACRETQARQDEPQPPPCLQPHHHCAAPIM